MKLIIFILGLLTGSFLNVVIYRLPRGESIVWPGSHCTVCAEKLKMQDLVPVISYLSLKGKCRYCGARISLCYPLVELLTGILFLLIYLKCGLSAWTGSGFILTGILISGSFTDLNRGIIPDRITLSGIVAGLVLAPFTVGIIPALIGAILFGGVLFAAAVLSCGGMGGGDVKLALVIGVFCGTGNAVLALMIASIAGGLWALVLLLSQRVERKSSIKFGPFLAISGYIAFLYGSDIVTVYLDLLGI